MGEALTRQLQAKNLSLAPHQREIHPQETKLVMELVVTQTILLSF
jgi:hypothetical protein